MAEKETILKLKGITKDFLGVRALENVDFDLRQGEVHVLLGENGAGKSTLMKILAGAYTANAGKIILHGREVKINNPKEAQDLGISIIYQEFNLVPYLNVAQNIFLGREPFKKGLPGIVDYKKLHEESRKILDSLKMEISTHTLVKDLGVAQQQMVEVAKALSLKAEILIMDEPTAALTDREIEQLFRTIRALKKQGVGIIYISHRLQEVHEIGDRVTVLRDGRLIGTAEVNQVGLDTLIKMMVGRKIENLFPRDILPKGGEALRVLNLSKRRVLHDVNLTVHCGEIVGLAGLVGSGRTELARAIFGADPYDEGEIYVFGKRVDDHTPAYMVGLGLGLLPEDRKSDGLALTLPVKDNVVLASLKRLFPKGILSSQKEQEVVKEFINQLRIATPSISRQTKYLSGGTQQKVVLAKWLCTQSRIFIFDEPTRGIDVGAKAEVHEFMNELVKQGAAILMISSELPEILGMSDRIYVMYRGTIVKELRRGETSQEEIISYAMGRGGDDTGE